MCVFFIIMFSLASLCAPLDAGRLLTQAGILTGLKHAHVVEMRGFYKWDKAYCLALEHMAGGELCDDIIRRVNYSEADARNVSSFFFPVGRWRYTLKGID